MELSQLKTFNVVAKNLHFTRAAEELNLSQPAVSHQIKSLEKEIGCRLFERDKSGVKLTDMGKILQKYSNKILDLEYEMKEKLNDFNSDKKDELVLGSVTRGMGNDFLSFYEKFIQRYQNINLNYQSAFEVEEIVEKVRSEEIDVGLVSHNPDLNGLEIVPFGYYEVFFAVGKNHRLAGKDYIKADELKNESWVMFEPSNRLTISVNNYLNKIGIKPKYIYETNDGAFVKSMVSSSQRVAFLPEWGIIEEVKSKRIFPIRIENFDFTIDLQIIYKPQRKSENLINLVNFLLETKQEVRKIYKQKF